MGDRGKVIGNERGIKFRVGKDKQERQIRKCKRKKLREEK